MKIWILLVFLWAEPVPVMSTLLAPSEAECIAKMLEWRQMLAPPVPWAVECVPLTPVRAVSNERAS